MSPEGRKVRDTSVAAVKLPPERWEGFLKQACAGDAEFFSALVPHGVAIPSTTESFFPCRPMG